MIDPHVLQQQANDILDVVGSDLAEGHPKDAIRLLRAVVDNPLVASLVVRVLDWADKHMTEGR